MKITRYNPFKELEKFFEEGFEIIPSFITSKKFFTPSIDIYEKGDSVFAEVNLAGYKPEEIDLEIEDNILKIRGEKKEEKEEKEKRYYKKELHQESFEREVFIPAEIDESNIKATLKDGILKIEMPKIAKQAKAKKIKIDKK